jgi:uncharacterized repeat protein (TIGR02543 family)
MPFTQASFSLSSTLPFRTRKCASSLSLSFALLITAVFAAGILAMGTLFAGTIFPTYAFADTGNDQSQENSPYNHEITLAPGSETDVTKAETATLYIIDKAGTYTLSGQTCSAHVTIRMGDVKLYLADGLSITPDYTSLASGTNCPAINIEKFDGTVEIISKAKASIKLESFQHSAAIQKNNLESKLVFKTEDEANPGTIYAIADWYGYSAGIGAKDTGLIRNESYTGNIVFESGKIHAEGGSHAAGIGGGRSTLVVKNITIKGTANVTAYGSTFGAGIGSGCSCEELDGINIEGGTVKAIVSSKYNYGGAGIGYGGWDNGNVRYGTITISGGNVTAKGGSCGAGIGGASKSCPQKILITGGTVKASSSRLGCGIGSGGFPVINSAFEIDNSLEEEKVSAEDAETGNESPGWYASYVEAIENGNTATNEDVEPNAMNCQSIEITGGDIIATGGDYCGAVGIGNSSESDGTQNISIKGGIVRAYSGKCDGGKATYAIGGGAKTCLTSKIHVSIDVSGGTIYAQHSSKKGAAFGSFDTLFQSPSKFLKCTISGGSILYDKDNKVGTFQVTPIDINGNDVSPHTVKLKGLTGTAKSPTRIDLSNTEALYVGVGYQYSTKNTTALSMADISGSGSEEVVFCPWFVDSGSLWRITFKTPEGEVQYSRSFATEYSEDFYPQTNITLDASNQNGEDGRTVAYYGGGTITESDATAAGYKVNFYTAGASPASTLVMDAGGKLVKNVEINGEKITDENANWVYEGGLTNKVQARSFTVYAQFDPINYTIAYDANKPSGVTAEVKGDLPRTVNAQGGNAYIIGDGGSLTLQGYKLAGWNTKPDGTGEFIDDGDTRGNLTSVEGATVTLYAQWEGQPYQIHFEGGEGATGSMEPLSATIGAAVELPLCTFVREGYVFAGWRAGVSVGGLYEDGAAVIDQCLKDEDGNYVYTEDDQLTGLTFTAVWLNAKELAADASVVVTKDGSYVKGLADGTANAKLSVETADHSVCYTPFVETEMNGVVVYVVKNSETRLIPEGIYEVLLDSVPTGKTITIDGQHELCTVSCSSVTATYDENISYVNRTLVDKGNVLENNVFINGTKLTYEAFIEKLNSGYSFGLWGTSGVAPTFVNDTTNKSNPTTIAVNGTTEIRANATPTQYYVTFDANGAPDGSDISGEMLNQKMFCYTKSSLTPNVYQRLGYTFSGWNTKSDGTGTFYENGQEVENLTTQALTVTLYAQWQPVNYQVYFDGNHGEGTMDPMQLIYGQEYNLAKNTFTRDDALFLGWNTERDGSGTAYKDGAAFSNLCTSEGGYLVLYAQWEEVAPDPDPDPDPSPSPDPSVDPAGGGGSDDPADGSSSSGKSVVSTGDVMGFVLAGVVVVLVVAGGTFAFIIARRRRKNQAR